MNKNTNKRKIGHEKEKAAHDFLEKNGYEIMEINYQTKYEEIDIIARDTDTLVFVEVKYRKNSSCGNPLESISYNKQRKICLGALYYLKANNLSPDRTSIRFDAIGITGDIITHIKNAFEFNGYLFR